MVQREQQPVLGLLQAQQTDTKQRTTLQVERLRGSVPGPPPGLRFTLFLGQEAEILHLQCELELRCDHLHRHRVFHLEVRAQRLVPPYELAQCLMQSFDLQRPNQTQDRRHVVHRPIRQQPVQQPQLLLAERRRENVDGLGPRLRQRPRRDGVRGR